MVSKYNFNSHPRRDGTHGERAFVVSAAALTSELAAGVGVRIIVSVMASSTACHADGAAGHASKQ